jgi:ABC-type branched-subunit amino acid transport system ATPase component
MDISKSMTEIWPLIQIVIEQHELVQRARQAIDKIREELGERPTEATEIIRFLNSKTKEELEALEIEDRTETILEVNKVLTKKGLMLQLEEKSQTMDIGVQRFFKKVDSLHKKGLLSLFVINDKLIILSEYKQEILIVAKYGSKFLGIQGSITGKAFLETL